MVMKAEQVAKMLEKHEEDANSVLDTTANQRPNWNYY